MTYCTVVGHIQAVLAVCGLQKEKERIASLNALLVQHGMETPGRIPHSPPLLSSSTVASDSMHEALRRFMTDYSTDPFVWPFLKGLSHLLKAQLGVSAFWMLANGASWFFFLFFSFSLWPVCCQSLCVWRWVMVSEAFTEGSYPRFMEDSVILLCRYFRYVRSSDDLLGIVPEGSHGWEVEHGISDRQIIRMMNAMKGAGSLDSRPAGSLFDTGIPRSNQDGALDEKSSAEGLCPACVFL